MPDATIGRRSRVATLVLAAGLVVAGCGADDRLDYSCAELKAEPSRYRALAEEIFDTAGERAFPGECDRACERKFTDSLEQNLRSLCRRGGDDLRPRDQIESELKVD